MTLKVRILLFFRSSILTRLRSQKYFYGRLHGFWPYLSTTKLTKVKANGNNEETNGSSKGVKRILANIDNKKDSTKKRVKK